jgi:hypothetical protein
MNTVFARKVRLLVLRFFDEALFILSCLMVSYTLFIDFQGGAYFILYQVLTFAILIASSFLWQMTKKEGWGDFSLIFYLAGRHISGLSIYIILMMPLGLLIILDIVPNKWFMYLGLALCAGFLSDFGVKFGSSENEFF